MWGFDTINYELCRFSVKVQSLQSNEAVVFKWDFGDVDQLSIDALRPLDSVCRSSPQAIFCARLYGKKIARNLIGQIAD